MRLVEFKEEYAKLVNMVYGELDDKQKQTVYSVEIYKDSGDALIACDIYADSLLGTLTPEFIDEQLRNTFEYNDTTVIESL